MNAVIARGVKTDDNVVIGAGSIVTKDCPTNGVYAGNPVRLICTMEDFYQKRKVVQFAEVKDIPYGGENNFGENPSRTVLCEYFTLFCDWSVVGKGTGFQFRVKQMMNEEETKDYLEQNPPMFACYEDFLKTSYDEE